MEDKKSIQTALRAIQSKLKSPKGQTNNFGHYRYRSAEDILEAVKPLLAENGCSLTISDDIVLVGNRIYVKATAILSNDGQSIQTTAFAREEDSKKGMDASQVTGAASSYARKYALNGLFCIDDTKDEDALNVNKEYTQPTKDDNLEGIIANINMTSTIEDLTRIWNECYAYQSNKAFMSALTNRKKQLQNKSA